MSHASADSGPPQHLPYGTRRVSAARRAIAQAARSLPGAFTVETLHAAACELMTGIGLATVYRAVAAMVESGYLVALPGADQRTMYAVCDEPSHHHHLLCTTCGLVAPVACPIDEASMRAAREAGFTVTHHDVILYGTCARCGQLEGRDD